MGAVGRARCRSARQQVARRSEDVEGQLVESAALVETPGQSLAVDHHTRTVDDDARRLQVRLNSSLEG